MACAMALAVLRWASKVHAPKKRLFAFVTAADLGLEVRARR